MVWKCRKPYNETTNWMYLVLGDLNVTPRNDDWLQTEWFEMTMRPKLTERGSITLYVLCILGLSVRVDRRRKRDRKRGCRVCLSGRIARHGKGSVANLKILFSRPSATASNSSSGRRGATFAQSLVPLLESSCPSRWVGSFPGQGCAGGNHIT